jgi:protein SCO1/2
VSRRGALLALALAGLAGLAACSDSSSEGEGGSAAATGSLPPAERTAAAGSIAASTVLARLDLPAPGRYTLDRIMPAPHGAVLDSDASSHRLAEYTTGKITLFSFVYTACSDAGGCPLALATMHLLKAAIERDTQLRERVRFVSMSFDPAHDTPPVMRSYGGPDALPAARPRWHFLTTQSARQLAPLLAGFGQDVQAARWAQDGAQGAGGTGGAGARPALAHLLKIYLLDARGEVREIYSPAFLQPAAMLGDMRNLVAEAEGERGKATAGLTAPWPSPLPACSPSG